MDFVLVSRFLKIAKTFKYDENKQTKVHVRYGRELFVLFYRTGRLAMPQKAKKLPSSSAHFFIIMKKLFLSLVAMMIATVSFAQSSLLATLSHDGTVKTFYGAGALKSAHEAAANGDVITLSSGTFQAVNITKAITLRGSGMDADTLTNRDPTFISGDFTINIADDVIQCLTIEGIYCNYKISYINVKNPVFLKSRFKEITNNLNSGNSAKLYNATFIHCKVSDGLYLTSGSSASCLGCVLDHPHNSSNSVFEFANCVIITGLPGTINNSNMKNCFVHNTEYYESEAYTSISETTTMFNNVGINTKNASGRLFKYATNSSNKIVSKLSDFFKTYTGKWDDNETFELTDEAKTKYLGTDGTQIGLYGGNLPFESTPSNPQITKCNVASKSTADGKLSVDITIQAAE